MAEFDIVSLSLLAVAESAARSLLGTPGAPLYLAGTVVLSAVGALQLQRTGSLWGKAAAATAISAPALVLLVATSLFLSALSVALLILVSVLAGFATLRYLAVKSDKRLDQVVLSLAVGLGLNGLVLYSLGVVGLLHLTAILPVEATLALASYGFARDEWSRFMREPVFFPESRPVILMVPILAIAMAYQAVLLYAMAPEIMYDSTFYHLTLVREFLETGRLGYMPNIITSAFPQLGHMLFAGAAALSSSLDSAKLVSYSLELACTAAIYALGRKLGGSVSGLIAAVLWLSSPLVLWEGATAYVDLFIVLWTLAAVLSLLIWADGRTPGPAYVLAFLVASGFGIRLTMGALGLALAAVILGIYVRTRRTLMLWITAGCLGFAVAAAWYGRALVLTGNPFFPYFNGVFRSAFWDLKNDPFNLGIFGIGNSPLDFLLVPWRLTVQTSVFGEVPDGALGLLPLIAWLAAAYAMIRGTLRVRVTALVFVLSVSVWFVSAQYARYLLPQLAIGAALAGGTTAALARHSAARFLAVAVSCVLLAIGTLGFVALEGSTTGAGPWLVDFGAQTRERYLEGALRHYAAYDWMNRHLKPRQTKVLGIGRSEFPIVYSTAPIYVADVTQAGRRVLGASSSESAAAALKDEGFTHVLVDLFPRETQSGYPVELQEVVARMRLVYANNYVRLYEPGRGDVEQVSERLAETEARPSDAWQPFGSRSSLVDGCGGLTVSENSGYFQTFVAKPDVLHVARFRVRAPAGTTAFARMEINWTRANGDTFYAIEVQRISDQAETYEMSTTSPADAVHGSAYLVTYGTTPLCALSVSVMGP